MAARKKQVARFEEIWAKIQQHAGETFYLLGGRTFTYEVRADQLQPSTSERSIARSDFERVHAMGEIPNQRSLKSMGFADAPFIFSILTDPRLQAG
jgi:hypothetical protein